jgi:Ca2+-binding EF-hand superfamily protein
LLKAFKYFDLDNSGECDKDEFLKAIQKIGITGFNQQNLEEIFDSYDQNKNGSLDYKELISSLYGNESLTSNKPTNKGPWRAPEKEKKPFEKHDYNEEVKRDAGKSKKGYMKVEGIEQIVTKIREKLGARGIRGMISIARAFKIMDDDRSGYLDMNEWKKAARDYRLDLNDVEIEKAFCAFDRNNDGQIVYDEFLRLIRGDMNAFRKKLVMQAFNKMDKDGSGELDINDIRGVYNAKFHPDVKKGKKTEEEVLLEFLETFEQHHNVYAGESADHVISKDEWMEYYENTSMSIDDDKYFELMINNAWRMNEHTTYNNEKKGWSDDNKGNVQRDAQNRKGGNSSGGNQSGAPQRDGSSNNVSGPSREEGGSQSRPKRPPQSQPQGQQGGAEEEIIENPILDKFRQKLFSRGGKGIIGLARQFKIFDDDNSKSLSIDEFAKAVKDFRVELSQNEVKVLFNLFDRDGGGTIDYDEFLRQVKGEMSPRRKRIVLQAFDKLDLDKSGVVDMNEIKSLYNCKNHPDVKSGKKTEEDVYGEFIETFEMHHNINKGTRDRRITKEEFLEYYNNISCSIDNDEYFDLMMTSAWKLGNQPAQQKAWASDVGGSSAGKNKQQPVQQSNRGQTANVSKSTPWGISDEPVNYSTSNNPNATAKPVSQIANAKPGSVEDSINKFRAKLASRGARGIMGLKRSFMICDDDNSKSIDINEFIKVCKDYRVGLEDNEVRAMFKAFDLDGAGSIDYEEFLRACVGEMNNFRKNLVKKAFNKLDKNGNGTLEVDDIKGVYNASKHPDVKAGKKTEDDVLGEFLDTFEYHFSITVRYIYNNLESRKY